MAPGRAAAQRKRWADECEIPMFQETNRGNLWSESSWPYVPVWYHVIFTALLIPMAIMGGRLKTAA